MLKNLFYISYLHPKLLVRRKPLQILFHLNLGNIRVLKDFLCKGYFILNKIKIIVTRTKSANYFDQTRIYFFLP